jgi:hypothetical protein
VLLYGGALGQWPTALQLLRPFVSVAAAAAAAAAAALAARQNSRIAAAESETLGSDPWNSSLNKTLLYTAVLYTDGS